MLRQFGPPLAVLGIRGRNDPPLWRAVWGIKADRQPPSFRKKYPPHRIYRHSLPLYKATQQESEAIPDIEHVVEPDVRFTFIFMTCPAFGLAGRLESASAVQWQTVLSV